jgi:hypothetical protein
MGAGDSRPIRLPEPPQAPRYSIPLQSQARFPSARRVNQHESATTVQLATRQPQPGNPPACLEAHGSPQPCRRGLSLLLKGHRR